MTFKILLNISAAINKFENTIANLFYQHLQRGLCLADISSNHNYNNNNVNDKFSLKKIWDNGFLWAVPKHRRNIERRLSRRFGCKEYVWKPLEPKTNIVTCRACGHFHEVHHVCKYCWEKIKAETIEMQEAMQKELKLDPVKDEITVLYEGEREAKPAEFWKGQRIVEMPKKRPAWFQQNLLQPTTQPLSDCKDVKPQDLA